MSYYIFNDLAELINGALALKTKQGIIYRDPIDREWNCSLPYNFNVKCFYKGKYRRKCLIYKVKFFLCDASYIHIIHSKNNERSFL